MEVLGVSTSARFHPDETESTRALPLDPAAFLKKAGENFQLICDSPFCGPHSPLCGRKTDRAVFPRFR